jgi:mono/diheme cytochrome c family protein
MIAHPGIVAVVLAAALVWPMLVAAQGRAATPKLGGAEYEGWRQYSAHCARCHGQDVVGNPVAADLLKSAADGGTMAQRPAFVSVVKAGRPKGGMPGFAKQLTEAQIGNVYAYVKGRADGKIPAGRPEKAGK